MDIRRGLVVIGASLLVLSGAATAVASPTTVTSPTAATGAGAGPAGAAVHRSVASSAASADATWLDECSANHLAGDARLGPRWLPLTGPVGRELFFYRPTGGRSAAAFLTTWYDPTAVGGTGGWRYPPASGYVVGPGGHPIEFRRSLRPGTDIDRFGSEYGTFLAPAGTPYAARSIPPQSLDGTPAAGCNYHDYEVLKPFMVDAGPIAPAFAQPGGGIQYQLDATLIAGAPGNLNVQWLVDHGYLRRLT